MTWLAELSSVLAFFSEKRTVPYIDHFDIDEEEDDNIFLIFGTPAIIIIVAMLMILIGFMYEKAKREAKLELLRRAEEGMDFEFDESMFAERETHEPKKNEAKKPGLLSQLFGSAGKAEKKGKKNDVKSQPKSTKPESKTKSASKSAVVSVRRKPSTGKLSRSDGSTRGPARLSVETTRNSRQSTTRSKTISGSAERSTKSAVKSLSGESATKSVVKNRSREAPRRSNKVLRKR